MLDIVRKRIQESMDLKKAVLESDLAARMVEIAKQLVQAFQNEKKILLCGNGGSAADAQHISAEFVNRFLLDRKPLPAIALTTDASIITSVSNDFTYEDIFVKQVEALGQSGDVLIGLSTSGYSKNVLKAFQKASENDLLTIAFTGMFPNPLAEHADFTFAVNSKSVPRVQEVHYMALHIICELVETEIFSN